MNTSDGTTDPMALSLITELSTLETLLRRGCLNETGLHYGYQFSLSANNTSAGNAAIIRERVLAGFINALAAHHGLPTNYWTDRLSIDVPDDIADLNGGESE